MLPVCSLLTFGVCLTGTGSDTHFELARGVDEVEETCLVLRGQLQLPLVATRSITRVNSQRAPGSWAHTVTLKKTAHSP